jgi:hypothetical protein
MRYEPKLRAAAATVKDDLIMSMTLPGCVVLYCRTMITDDSKRMEVRIPPLYM